MADLETLMYGNMVHSAQEVENLRRQRDYYNRIQNQGAFDQYGGYPQYGGGGYGMGYGGGRGNYNSAVQKLMMSHDLTVQRMLLEQQINQQKVADEAASTRQERERRLAAIRKKQDEIKNNPELDQNSFEVQNELNQLDDAAFKAETELELNPVDIQKIPSGNVDKEGKPIETWIVYKANGDPFILRDGNKVVAGQLERDKFEQGKLDAAREANMDQERLEIEKKTAETERAKVRNTADAQSNSSMDKKLEVADKLEARKREAAEKRREKSNDRFYAQQDALDTEADDYDQKWAQLEQQRLDALDAFDKKEALEEWKGDPSAAPTDITPTYRPTAGEVQDEIRRRNLLNKDEPTGYELNEQVQYDSPMDAEFSDEQFAGTEPAGLYDPTGQPLQMEGGMYSGFA